MIPLLPQLVRWLIHLAIPAGSRDMILRDLAEEYAIRRAQPGAAWWLLRETMSLVWSYAAESVRRLRATTPVLMRDLTLVIRSLRRAPVAALGSAAMLSSGLAAVMVTSGLTNTLLLRKVSATHGDALRRIATVDRDGRTSMRLSLVELRLVEEDLADVAQIGAVSLQPVVIRLAHDSIQTMVEVVRGPYFALAGTSTLTGRGLLTIDEQPGASPTVVISEPFWRRHFDASPAIVGASLHLNGEPYTVIGVARALGSSTFLGASVDAWVSTAHADPLLNRGWRTAVDERAFTAFVLPGVSAAQMQARLASATAMLARTFAQPWRDRTLQLADSTVLLGTQRTAFTVLAVILGGLSLLILATAAANLGGLLLARTAATRRQVAIHLSIGSGRSAIVRRQLLEGALLGSAGAGMAVGIYAWVSAQVSELALLPTLLLRLNLPLGPGMLIMAFSAGAAAGVVLALGPALWAARVELADAMRDDDRRSGGSPGLSNLRRALVSAQVGLTLVLVVAATLFMKSVDAMVEADLGFDRDRLIAFDFDLEPAATADMAPLAREALRRVAATPGVEAAAMSDRAPIDSSTPVVDVRRAPGDEAIRDASMYLATPRYFDTVGVPLLAGRPFTEDETATNASVAIINDALARQLFPAGGALDRPVFLGDDASPGRVVGIARDSKYRSILESARPHIYRPTPPALGRTLLARTSRDPREVLRELQRVFDSVGPGLVGFFPRTMDDHLAIQLLPARAAATAAAVLGTLALGFSGFGLYGLVSWFVELRRREIGVRLALGASTTDVRRMVVRQALAAAAPGLAAGVLLSVAFGLSARAALFGVQPVDLTAIGGGIAALIAVVAAAAYAPSRRATAVDPAITLRS